LFSSAQLATRDANRPKNEEDMQSKNRQTLLTSDPPYHEKLRSLVNQAFTPRMVALLAPQIRDSVHFLLDQAAALGRLDIIDDLAAPLPAMVIAALLGVPSEDREHMRRWTNHMAQNLLKPPSEAGHQVYQEMSLYFQNILSQRRREPREDLISALLAAQIDGHSLSERELLNFCSVLLAAGSETTTHLIGNMILCLDAHPEVVTRLRMDRQLLSGAVEEMLRYHSPLQWVARVVQKETTLAGKRIKAGEILLSCVASANRDETQFPDPDTFDITRHPNRHLAFGHGIHFCLGAPLARLEAQIVLSVILERCMDLSIDKTIPLERVPAPLFYGVKHLPIKCTPLVKNRLKDHF
jgi:cytochrome P450